MSNDDRNELFAAARRSWRPGRNFGRRVLPVDLWLEWEVTRLRASSPAAEARYQELRREAEDKWLDEAAGDGDGSATRT